jgi:hypothetical protein
MVESCSRVLRRILLTLAASCPLLAGTSGVGCLEAAVQKVSPAGSGGFFADIQLSNNCGKDITAFRLVLRDGASGEALTRFGQELLLCSTGDYVGQDILRDGNSKSVQVGVPVQSVAVAATGALFLDGSAAGEAAEIAQIRQSVQAQLARLRQEAAVLGSVKDYVDAMRRLHDAEDGSTDSGSAAAIYSAKLSRSLDRSDPAAWAKLVESEQKRLTREITLYDRYIRTMALAVPPPQL